MEKLITIIIATYNVEKVIEGCLDAIRAIKMPEIELVIVDGSSKDKSLEIIKSKYNDIVDTLISEPDRGLYDAWNKGIKRANGKWIMFLGADDRLIIDNYKQYTNYVKTIDFNQYDIISARAEYVDNNGKLIKIVGSKFDWEIYKKLMEISHGSTMHNKQLFIDYGGYDINFKICADYEFLMRKGESVRADFFNLPVLKFTAGGASFSMGCQKDTYNIRKKYHTVNNFLNLMLCLRRVCGMYYRRVKYNIE